MQTIVRYVFLVLIILLLVVFIWFFVGTPKKAEKINWGVNFSQKQAIFLEIDPKEAYLALLQDLNIKNIKIAVHWDLLEIEKDKYDFSDLDWQMSEAQKNNAKIVLAIGMKTPRWPECHIPQWAINLNKKQQQEQILKYLTAVINRYKDSSAILAWQVENEPFLAFGSCPWSDENFLKQEILLVKQIDQNKHPIIITDSGEMSTWTRASNMGGDMVGFTTYRMVWQETLKQYVSYSPWYTPMFYYRRAQVINMLYGKKAIGVELQAEPWCQASVMLAPIEEQQKTMSLDQLKKNIQFAKDTGIDTYYLWGGEWWYWMKEKQNHPEYWQEIKKLFAE
ncbi:MAG: beta-galactosidase [Candidatus Paceibacterota bacterium]|jgi:hypothetical protein